MPITISGIRVDAINVKPDTERGGYKIETAEYSLMSSAGKALAKQTIGGYGGMVLAPSPDTEKALTAFADSYAKDVQALLGLE